MQLPSLPHLPKSTWRQSYIPDLMLERRGSNTPNDPHPEFVIGHQLPPIRNLVPNLWEPGTSKSSQKYVSDEGGMVTSVYRLRTPDPAWSDGSTGANDKYTPHPRPETDRHENESNRGTPRQVSESNKRPPPSPIEREDHPRTAPSNGVIDSNRWTISHAHRPSQTSNPTREKADIRPLSNSEATHPKGESAWSGPQPPHQQELLRDPVGKLWSLLTHGWLTCPHLILAFRLTATLDTSTTHDDQ